MSTRTIADGLARKHGTRAPFNIANELGFIVVFAPLVDMRGFQHKTKRRRFIYINDQLDEQQQRLVCTHELAHHLLHRGMNRIFMDQNTYMVTRRYETEASHFAVDLIFSDEELQPFLFRSYECAAAYMGVSNTLAEYRLGEVVPEHPAEEWS